MDRTRFFFGLLTFITFGMIIGSLLQLAFIQQLEESDGIHKWANDEDAGLLRLGLVKPEVISWSPRIIVFHNFLSMEECDFLRAIAKPRLRVTTVVDIKTGKGIESDVRTSSGMFVSPEERKYPLIQKYGGQRVATMLMYLSDDVVGGETYFPLAGEGQCSCGGKTVTGTCVKPVKGDAVLFWSLGLEGGSDANSLHGACEVLDGEKWSATKWMRQSSTF